MSKPVLGIMTLYLDERKKLEERHIYEHMIKEGKAMGLDVYVFTPAEVNSAQGLINAMEYDPDHQRWSRRWRSFPDMIFDRCRIQKSPRFQQLLRFRSRYRYLLFLNRPLRNKWTIHQILSTKNASGPICRTPGSLRAPVTFTGCSMFTLSFILSRSTERADAESCGLRRCRALRARMKSGDAIPIGASLNRNGCHRAIWRNIYRAGAIKTDISSKREYSWSCRTEECMTTECSCRKTEPVNGR